MKITTRAFLLAGSTVLAALAWSAPAMAQDAAPETKAPEKAAIAEEIIVTGSRISKAGFEAPTPTTVVDASVLASSPQTNIAQNLNQLPALAASISPRTAGNAVGGGTQGVNFLNLRSLGATRTLVLLDHRRVVGAATTGSVDLNLLPSTLITRVDVVTGGASAAWGSDAVAGVVNLVLDKKFVGIKAAAQTGVSTYGDAREYRLDLAVGREFAGGRGHFIGSVSYAGNDSVDSIASRPWWRGPKLISNPAYAPGNGQPKLVIADHVNSPTATFGGLVTAYRLANGSTVTSGGPVGTQYLAGGVAAPFNFGTVGTTVTGLGNPRLPGSYAGSQLSINGTPNDLAAIDQIIADTSQLATFARASFDVTDNINVYGEFIYGRSVADSLSVPYLTLAPNGAPLSISRSNAFLPAATAAAMDAVGATAITLGRANADLGLAAPHNERQLYRYVAGVDADLGGSWTASVYYEHALSKVLNEVRSDAIVSNVQQAVDAVRVDAGNVGTSGLALGSVVCRSTLSAPTNGCVPFNVFGPQTVTAAQQAWLIGVASQSIRLTQDVVAGSINGDLFSLPAGTVTIAAGLEYRSENHTATADANSQRNNTNTGPGTGNWWVGNYKPSTGGYNVKEGFAEILIPVLKDSAIGRRLDFNGAVRVTDYSTSGSVVTWKAGATWDIAGGFKLRGVASRDIRAPNLAEYFLGGTASSVSVIDGPNGAVGVLRIQSGNTKLRPETAATLTLGAVYQPEFLRGFSVALDYFRIKIKDAIATPTPQYIIDRCRDGTIPSACSLLVRDGTGKLTTVLVQPLNYKTEFMSGFDLEASYRFKIGAGTMTARSLWTYTGKHYLIDNGTIDDLLGEVAQAGGPTKLRGFNSVNYDTDHFSASLRHRFIGQGVLDAAWTAADVSNNTVPAVSYFDISAIAKIKTGGRALELFGSVDNLFNKAPPVAPQTGGNPNTNLGSPAQVYDLIGRMFHVGIRVKM